MAILDEASAGLFGPDNTKKFRPTEMNYSQKGKNSYVKNSNLYTPEEYTAGGSDVVGGGLKQTALEESLGTQNFNGDDWEAKQNAGQQAMTAKSVKGIKAQVGNQAMQSGLGASGFDLAGEAVAQAEGDTADKIAAANIAAQRAGIQQNENQFRTRSALDIAGQGLQDKQFGAGLTEDQNKTAATLAEGQNEFQANSDLATAGQNATIDANNNAMRYGIDQDQYTYNELAPEQRNQKRKGAILDAGTTLAGAGIQGAGSIAGKALLV